MKQLDKRRNMFHVRVHRCNDIGELRKLQEERQKVCRRIKELRRQRYEGVAQKHTEVQGRAAEMFQEAQARLNEAFMNVSKLATDTLEELVEKGEEEDDE